MSFLQSAFEALPQTATHPFAFVSYVIVVIAWLALAFKVKRNNQLLKNLEKVPAKDRLEALRLEMGAVQLKEGLSAEDWLRHRRQLYYFLAFLAGCVVFVVLFVIAVVEVVQSSNLERSRAEFIRILQDREENFIAAHDQLIEALDKDPTTGEFAPGGDYRTRVVSLKDKILALSRERRSALLAGNLIRAHELGNEIHNVWASFDSRKDAAVAHSPERSSIENAFIGLHGAIQPMVVPPGNFQRLFRINLMEVKATKTKAVDEK